MALAVVRTEVG